MKKVWILLSALLLVFSSCTFAKDGSDEVSGNNQVTVYPSAFVQDTINDDDNANDASNTEKLDNILQLNAQEEMLQITLGNGRYNITPKITKIVSDFKAKVIEQDEKSTIIQLDTEYADQKFRIPSSQNIELQVVEAKCPIYHNMLQDPPNLYRLTITIGVLAKNTMYNIGEINININDYEEQLNIADTLFEADTTYQVLNYMSYEQTFQNFHYLESEYDLGTFRLYFTGIPGEYYGVRYEETWSADGTEYAYWPVDTGQVYTLSDNCEIFGINPDWQYTKEFFPESSYSHSYYHISEKQLRTAVVRGFMTNLFGCYIIEDTIVRIGSLYSP